jgi:hypothetical protein
LEKAKNSEEMDGTLKIDHACLVGGEGDSKPGCSKILTYRTDIFFVVYENLGPTCPSPLHTM